MSAVTHSTSTSGATPADRCGAIPGGSGRQASPVIYGDPCAETGVWGDPMVAEPVAGARGALSATMRQRCEASFGEVPAEPLTVVATSVCVIGSAILPSEPRSDWWVVRFVGLSTGRRRGPAGVHWRLAARQAGGVCVGAVGVGRSCSLLLRGSGRVALIAAREGTSRSDERSSPPAAWREILGVVG